MMDKSTAINNLMYAFASGDVDRINRDMDVIEWTHVQPNMISERKHD